MESPRKLKSCSKQSSGSTKQSETTSFLTNYAKFYRENREASKKDNFLNFSKHPQNTSEDDLISSQIKTPPVFKTNSNRNPRYRSSTQRNDWTQEEEEMNKIALQHLYSLPAIPEALILDKSIYLPSLDTYKKTLVLDLDETLIHSVTSPHTKCEVKLKIRKNSEIIGINIRPFLHEFLQKASFLFEVIVFTASLPTYANTVLDYLDPTNSIFKHRLYRNQCIPHGALLVKDLRVLQNRNLKDIAIVDNSISNFALQMDNGIPIKSWYDDYSDRELLKLSEYLDIMYHAVDVRKTNLRHFNLRNYYRKCSPHLDQF